MVPWCSTSRKRIVPGGSCHSPPLLPRRLNVIVRHWLLNGLAAPVWAPWEEHPDLVFPTHIGTPTDPRNALRAFEKIADRAGLAGVGLHTLRHSAASALIASGAHLKVVQEMLGHSSYAITADIYSHVAMEQQREAAQRLGEVFQW